MLMFLFPVLGSAELENRSYLDESIKGFRLYKRPKVTIPAGWKEHEAAGQELQGVFLVRNGKEPQNSEVTIYAIAVRKADPSETLQSFIKEDIENFKNGANQGVVTKTADFNNTAGQLTAYRFSYNNEGKRFVQTTVFMEEAGYFLSFVLTGKSLAAHDSGLSTFTLILSTYR